MFVTALIPWSPLSVQSWPGSQTGCRWCSLCWRSALPAPHWLPVGDGPRPLGPPRLPSALPFCVRVLPAGRSAPLASDSNTETITASNAKEQNRSAKVELKSTFYIWIFSLMLWYCSSNSYIQLVCTRSLGSSFRKSQSNVISGTPLNNFHLILRISQPALLFCKQKH